MAASSSGSRIHDVFPSFRGEDVRTRFLSHLLKALDNKSILTFSDKKIDRSCPITPELLSAIRESSISIVIFSENYASSTWCLNELVEIHNCFTNLGQKVIPVFYHVNPSDVRKQNGKFGEVFKVTCKDKTEGEKQRWMQALTDVASMAGEDIQPRDDEAHMVEKIVNDVSNKLFPPPNSYGEFVGIEAHLEALISKLSLESMEAKMIGIWGTSGIGKSTIGRALFSKLSSQFTHRNFTTYKSTDQDVSGMKSNWEQKFLSEILGQKDLKIDHFGLVEKRFKDKKVLIVLDDVHNREFLKTLVGKIEWFGPGSRIIVITQDKRILEDHAINLLYEVKLPSHDLALKMLCRSAFEQDYPLVGFEELAVEVAKLAGNLPLGLSVLGSSLKGRGKPEWIMLLHELQNSLDGDIMKTLRVSYDRLAEKHQYLFRYIACLFNGESVESINEFLGDVRDGLKKLAEKSIIRITQYETVEMHNLLEKLAREIDRVESMYNPEKRRFLENAHEIQEVLTDQKGTETILGINFTLSSWSLDEVSLDEVLIDEVSPDLEDNPFKGMLNLQFLNIFDEGARLCLPKGLVYLPRKLKKIEWDNYPLKCLPSNFKAEFLIELIMVDSKLEKLWEGTQRLKNLKKMNMRRSDYLKEIPDLSQATNLERVDLWDCKKLERFSTRLSSKSLEYLDLRGCVQLENFPMIRMQNSFELITYQQKNIYSKVIEIEVYDCLWNKNLPGHDYLDCFRTCNQIQFRPEHLVSLIVKGSNMLEKLCQGVELLKNLLEMDLSDCGNLTEIPDLSEATKLEKLILSRCESLVVLPSTIGNLHKLKLLYMNECTGLEDLPLDVNLLSLELLDLSGCSSLKSFPQISKRISTLKLDATAIEEVPCCTEILPRLTQLSMSGCNKLRNISSDIFRHTSLKEVNFTDCEGLITVVGLVATTEDHYENVEKRNEEDGEYLSFQNCFTLDGYAREFILRSSFKWIVVLPGEEVPTCFERRTAGNSLTVTLPQSSLSQEFLRFNACLVVEPLTDSESWISVEFHFNGEHYMHIVDMSMPLMCKIDHLVLCSFKFPRGPPSKLDLNVKFDFSCTGRIKECGIRLLNLYNQQSGEKFDVVETERSKKQMQMTLEKSEDLHSGQIVTDRGLTAPNLELPFGRGESSSVSSCPSLGKEDVCVDFMITEQQDAQIPICHGNSSSGSASSS